MAFKSAKSKIQENRVSEAIRNNPERLLFSKTLDAIMAERKRERERKKQQQPRVVRELIRIIDEGLIDPSLIDRDKRLQKVQMGLVANMLAYLNLTDAQRLEEEISGNISEAVRSKKEKLTISDLGEIVVLFMTLIEKTKKERIGIVYKKLGEINSTKSYPDAKVVLVFAWNPNDTINRTFDWGCLLK